MILSICTKNKETIEAFDVASKEALTVMQQHCVLNLYTKDNNTKRRFNYLNLSKINNHNAEYATEALTVMQQPDELSPLHKGFVGAISTWGALCIN